VLRGIYPDREIVDHWTPTRTVVQRQRALLALGIDLGPMGVDGFWGHRSQAALRRFQSEHGLVPNGSWSTFVSRRLHQALAERGMELEEVAGS
jgi:hypothetical protein